VIADAVEHSVEFPLRQPRHQHFSQRGAVQRAVSANFAEWEVVLAGVQAGAPIQAYAEDAAGNVEQRPHVVVLR